MQNLSPEDNYSPNRYIWSSLKTVPQYTKMKLQSDLVQFLIQKLSLKGTLENKAKTK